MPSIRTILRVSKNKPTIEGAGVRLKRVFGNQEPYLLDPFLLLDDFHSNNPKDYIAGFPSHPHRGIETVTYILAGQIKHEDSIGNKGVIRSGDIQWMTAGSGIIHSEMPEQKNGLLWGFQLWCNLPSKSKMMNPRYQEITKNQIPELTINKARIKVICGKLNGTQGPVKDIVTDPEYLDISISSGAKYIHSVKKGYTVFAYVIDGESYFDQNQGRLIPADHLVIFNDGTEVIIQTRDKPVRFLLISGKPIKEPIAWYGPIVMNTQTELNIAFEEYRKGTFLKQKSDE
ncbi:MAG: pirin family protein [Candidatus Hodarchaeota archaeon]